MDFEEAFSPATTSACRRLLAATVVMVDIDIVHLDAEQAFIQSNLEEDICIKLTLGGGYSRDDIVYLNKSPYGLK